MKFDLHTIESAPEASKPELELAEKAYGFIPNLFRGFAANPATLKVYMAFNELLEAHGCLSPIERQVVYLTVSAENGCNYCVAAHSVAAVMSTIPDSTLEELRGRRPLSDSRLEALRCFVVSVMTNHGWVSDEDLASFEGAGYEQCHVLEVITILAQKTMSNYFNHMAHTPLDEMFESMVWEDDRAISERDGRI